MTRVSLRSNAVKPSLVVTKAQFDSLTWSPGSVWCKCISLCSPEHVTMTQTCQHVRVIETELPLIWVISAFIVLGGCYGVARWLLVGV